MDDDLTKERRSDVSEWTIDRCQLRIGNVIKFSIQRTVSVTATSSSPPKSYGASPLWPVDEKGLSQLGVDVLTPVGASEAFWIGLVPVDGAKATAVRIAARLPSERDLVDVTTGGLWGEPTSSPQNYVVVPPQHALYGFTSDTGWATQFKGSDDDAILKLTFRVSTPFATAEQALSRSSIPLHSALQSAPRHDRHKQAGRNGSTRVPQEIAKDRIGLAQWDFGLVQPVSVGIVSHKTFQELSGLPGPHAMDDSQIYGGWNLP